MEDDDYHHLNKIEDNLWLGNSFAAGEVKDLKEKGITKILTVMNGFPNKYKIEDGFKHKIIDIFDISFQNIIQYFGECLNFIKGNKTTFVHCGVGASRSATIVIAYLMWKNIIVLMKLFLILKKKLVPYNI